VKKALEKGANSSVRDWEIERRYPNFAHDHSD
jgi:hypothetical protein